MRVTLKELIMKRDSLTESEYDALLEEARSAIYKDHIEVDEVLKLWFGVGPEFKFNVLEPYNYQRGR